MQAYISLSKQKCIERHRRYLSFVIAIDNKSFLPRRSGSIKRSIKTYEMAFTMRQPLRLTSAIGLVSKSTLKSAPVRAFHQARPTANFFTSRNTTPAGTLVKARNAFKQSRTYMQQPVVSAADKGNLMQKLLVGGAMFGGTMLVRTISNILYISTNIRRQLI